MPIEDYKYLRQIGKGAYGEALLYVHKKDKKQYVVKKMDISDPEIKRTADLELEHLRSLDHKYIVAYKEGYCADQFMYLIMEYCEGGDLEGVIKKKRASRTRITEDQILTWTLQICLGLKYLHDNHVIHRDMKPANVFMTADKQVKLGDFGIARQLKPGDLAQTVIGTPLYISPEIVAGVPYDGKTDIWSLGCCVYEMMTLHTAVDPIQLALRHNWVIGPMPTADYSSELTTLTDLMMTIDAADRPTVSEILDTEVMQTTLKKMDPGAASPPRAKSEPTPAPVPAAAATPPSLAPAPAAPAIPPSHPPAPVDESAVLAHGFIFNADGQLREKTTDTPFKYDVTGDRIRNEQRYQELAMSITNYIESHLEKKLKMTKMYLPLDAKAGEARCCIYATADFMTNSKKLMVLVQGNGAPRAGEWARKVIINDSLDAGSQIPWVKRGLDEGYSVLLLNPNANTEEIDGKHLKVRGNDSGLNHVTYVWENVITMSPAKQIAIVAHSYGGRNTIDLAIEKPKDFTEHVAAIAFTDSSHVTDTKTPREIVKFLQTKTKHWVANDKTLDSTVLVHNDKSPCVSAGDIRHEWTTWSCYASVFAFFKGKLE